ncbi:hypothetical protein J416_15697 [Gracilibacillus halophilus YIM-C55.5]|uniref:Spo0E like sporulation regulatory protein n=1 Tax=Gracilibacillus halophilus YIM-C55.5 TaxID=1308866 RepID=N4W8H4_9BACI|nr:Spo0E family sporulation regulatory protein-aspartic acid phosphatase [Gracilibacillus halophilus]ENH95514.1 hypothetical protein J416_15697 [Gracilibacillus halophilus YIM-C55.5]
MEIDEQTEMVSKRIEVLRDEFLIIGFRDGLTVPTTVRKSELLDEQIDLYQRLKE